MPTQQLLHQNGQDKPINTFQRELLRITSKICQDVINRIDIPRGIFIFSGSQIVNHNICFTFVPNWDSQYDPYTPLGPPQKEKEKPCENCTVVGWLSVDEAWHNMTPSTRMTTAPNLVNPLSLPQEIG